MIFRMQSAMRRFCSSRRCQSQYPARPLRGDRRGLAKRARMSLLGGLELKQRSGGWAGEVFTGASTFHVTTDGR